MLFLPQSLRPYLCVLAFFGISLVTSGCSLIYKSTGLVVHDLTDRHVTPYTLSVDDIEVACSTTQGLQPLVLAFTRVNVTPERAGLIMNVMSGICAEQKATEVGLSYIRSLKSKNVSDAKDARIVEKRHYAQAASRMYRAWNFMIEEFGQPGMGQCPRLDKMDGVYWALGNLAGLQAVIDDLKSDNQLNFPKDIAMQAVRGMQCLDNDQYWGMPLAATASLALLIPDSSSDATPWSDFESAGLLAEQSGIRLVHAIEAQVAETTGNEDELRTVIRRHAESLKNYQPDTEFQLLDSIATQIVTGISDRLWTEGTGARTPVGALGTFWDDEQEQEPTLAIDDLLEDF